MKTIVTILTFLLIVENSLSQDTTYHIGIYIQDTCYAGPTSGCRTSIINIKSNGKYVEKWSRGISIKTIKEGHWIPWRGKHRGKWAKKNDNELELIPNRISSDIQIYCKINNKKSTLAYTFKRDDHVVVSSRIYHKKQ